MLENEVEAEIATNSNARGKKVNFNEAKKSQKAQEALQKVKKKREEKLKGKKIKKLISEGDHFDVVELDEEGLKALKNDADVEYLEEDYAREPEIQTVDWGHAQSGVTSFINSTGKTGRGVTVAVVDSGINYNHEDLKNANLTGLKFNGETGALVSTNLIDCMDYTGHGTAVGGTIVMQNNSTGYVGVAPDVNLLSIKATGSDTDSTLRTSALVGAINYIVDNNVKVDFLNISFAETQFSKFVYDACLKAYNKGIIITASAGNFGDKYPREKWEEVSGRKISERVNFWREYPNVVVVGAVGKNSTGLISRKEYSSYGEGITLTAPSGLLLPLHNNNTGYDTFEGTSFSAPFVAGALALLKSALPNNSNSAIVSVLKSSFIAKAGSSRHFGAGVLSLDSNINSMDSETTLNKDFYESTFEKTYAELTLFGRKSVDYWVPVKFSGYPQVRLKIYASGDWNKSGNTLSVYPLGALHPTSVTSQPLNYYNSRMDTTLKDLPEDSLLIADLYVRSGKIFDLKLTIESNLPSNGKGRLFFVTEDASHLQF